MKNPFDLYVDTEEGYKEYEDREDKLFSLLDRITDQKKKELQKSKVNRYLAKEEKREYEKLREVTLDAIGYLLKSMESNKELAEKTFRKDMVEKGIDRAEICANDEDEAEDFELVLKTAGPGPQTLEELLERTERIINSSPQEGSIASIGRFTLYSTVREIAKKLYDLENPTNS